MPGSNPTDIEHAEPAPPLALTLRVHGVPTTLFWTGLVTFYWVIFGLAGYFGVRIWHDDPIDPSFLPFMYVCFAVHTAFVVVLTLSYAAGNILFKAPGGFEFQGASGPIV